MKHIVPILWLAPLVANINADEARAILSSQVRHGCARSCATNHIPPYSLIVIEVFRKQGAGI